jgi:hypothetical protein
MVRIDVKGEGTSPDDRSRLTMQDSKNSTIINNDKPPQLGRSVPPVFVPIAAAIKIMIIVWKIMSTIRGLPPKYMRPAAAKRPPAKRPCAMA